MNQSQQPKRANGFVSCRSWVSCGLFLAAAISLGAQSAACTWWAGGSGAWSAAAEPDSAAVKSPSDTPRLRIPAPSLIEDPRTVRRPLPREPRRDPFLHAARSLVLPGWGQHALGDGGGALFYGFAFGTSIPLWTSLAPFPLIEDDDFSQRVGFALWGVVAALAALDAFRAAEQVNRDNGYDLDELLFDRVRTPPALLRVVLWQRDF